MRGGLGALCGLVEDMAGIVLDFFQGRSQPQGITADFRTIPVGFIFAGSADRHLHNTCRHGSQEHGGDDTDNAEGIVAVAAEKEGEIGQHADCTCQCGGDCHGQCVAVFDMRQLMGHDGSNFFFSKTVKQSGAGGNRCVFRAATCGECVGLICL